MRAPAARPVPARAVAARRPAALPLPLALALAAAAALALAAPAHAQARASADAPADSVALPEAWRSLRGMPAPGAPEFLALREALADGSVDPLALLRRIAPRAAVAPEGARYERACSVAIGDGTVIFSLGAAQSAELRAALDDGVARERAVRDGRARRDAMGDFRTVVAVGNAMASDPRVQRAAGFYRAHGFTPLPVRAFVPFQWDRDGEARRVRVTVWGLNAAAAGSGRPECRAAGEGPVIALHALPAPEGAR